MAAELVRRSRRPPPATWAKRIPSTLVLLPRQAQRPQDAAVAIALLLSAAALIAIATIGYALVAVGPEFIAADPGSWPLLVCVVAVILLPTASWVGLRKARVAGGSGQLRLFEHSVLVPPPFAGPAMVFAFDGLEIDVQRFEGRFMFQTVSVVEVLRFRGDGKVRSLTSRTFESPERLQELVRDIEALSMGAPLPRPPRPPRPQAAPEPALTGDKYDEQLDDALNEFIND